MSETVQNAPKDAGRRRGVHLPEQLGAKVDDELDRLSITFSTLVRIALSRYFERPA